MSGKKGVEDTKPNQNTGVNYDEGIWSSPSWDDKAASDDPLLSINACCSRMDQECGPKRTTGKEAIINCEARMLCA